jgi:hypothetical protein
VAGRALLHPSLVSRLGKQCTTILDEAKNQRVEGEYRPPNVKPDILPVFA